MREEYGVESVAPAHCTGHLGFEIFKKVFGVTGTDSSDSVKLLFCSGTI